MNQKDRPSIVSPDDQSVTFVELFFDLVFVFSVTQVVGARLALGAGMLLFTGSMALALWRGTGRLPATRLLIGLMTALAITLWASAKPAALLALVFLGAIAISWSQRQGESVSAL